MKKILAEYAPLLGIGAVIVILDQFTKNWVRSTLDFMEIYRPDLWITEYRAHYALEKHRRGLWHVR